MIPTGPGSGWKAAERRKGDHTRAAIQTSALVVVLVVAVGAASAAYAFLSAQDPVTQPSSCDTQLLGQIGAAGTGLCLRPMNVVVSSANSSEFYVPVLVMKPGITATVDVLYHTSAGTYVSHSGLKPNITSADLPVALSVASARVNATKVGFSDGTVLFQSGGWVIFSYQLSASADSAGYYAVLPPDYVGTYPALAVLPKSTVFDINSLNSIGWSTVQINHSELDMSALGLWGYSGPSQSGEIILPSVVVGASGLAVLNVTVPITTACQGQACELISHSLY